ncbi:hypothetical protein AKJ16_DCAP25976 [Drosera capensis]
MVIFQLTSSCDIHPLVGYKDSSVLRFSNTVTGYLEKGKLVDIEGVKTKFMIWVKVTSISTDGPKLHVMAGMKKTRSREALTVVIFSALIYALILRTNRRVH